MTAAVVEVMCYRAGVRRPVRSGSSAYVARKYKVSERALQRHTRLAISYLPTMMRNMRREDRMDD